MLLCVSKVAGLAAEAVEVSGVMMENLCMEECKDGRRRKAKGARYLRRRKSAWETDYLDSNTIYPNHIFQRSFRVPRNLFLKLHIDLLCSNDTTWKTQRDGIGRHGIRSEIKIIVCLRLLGSGRSIDDLDDSEQMGRETIRSYFNLF